MISSLEKQLPGPSKTQLGNGIAAGDNTFAHIREQTDFAGKVVCLSRREVRTPWRLFSSEIGDIVVTSPPPS